MQPGHKLEQKIRFGWWGAEEEGLIGSRYYASHLRQSEVNKIDGGRRTAARPPTRPPLT